MALTFTPETRRDEPAATEDHFHVWTDTGGLAMLAQPPRFRTYQAARQAALRRMDSGSFRVMACRQPCRFTLPRKRRRRRPCRHCGRAP